jgi:hypothetical protein
MPILVKKLAAGYNWDSLLIARRYVNINNHEEFMGYIVVLVALKHRINGQQHLDTSRISRP